MNENSIPFYKYFLKFLNIGTFALTLLQTCMYRRTDNPSIIHQLCSESGLRRHNGQSWLCEAKLSEAIYIMYRVTRVGKPPEVWRALRYSSAVFSSCLATCSI